MCGGDIQATENTYGNCESCGSTMTLPKASDDRTTNLFNRANHLRRLNDFDKAMQTYENILNEDNSNAEAHWGLILSKYGIEYVEDPSTGKRVPTCHRVQRDPILSDADYLFALENAPDQYSKSLYEEEARVINEIQKGILAISNNVAPYDVFICYKESTDGGNRTVDSTIAQDIYYQLENSGYRVFFSRLTLEGKLGQQYEPYIFSALNSAKVMLVVGTKPEYFNAVWVKNEWSRYLTLTKNDRSRLLIPCYRDMDAYDIPEELASLQSQDMSKVGFIQDILHGVKKVLDASKATKTTNKYTTGTSQATPGVDSLMKRGVYFLEDSDWKQADDYFNRVLDIEPEYAHAYIGKLCAELKIKREAELENSSEPLENKLNFQKALRFADLSYHSALSKHNEMSIFNTKKTLNEKYNQLIQQKGQCEAEANDKKYDIAILKAQNHLYSCQKQLKISRRKRSIGSIVIILGIPLVIIILVLAWMLVLPITPFYMIATIFVGIPVTIVGGLMLSSKLRKSDPEELKEKIDDVKKQVKQLKSEKIESHNQMQIRIKELDTQIRTIVIEIAQVDEKINSK
jgi:tetratricopeptide (TPR) repeat protein